MKVEYFKDVPERNDKMSVELTEEKLNMLFRNYEAFANNINIYISSLAYRQFNGKTYKQKKELLINDLEGSIKELQEMLEGVRALA